MEFFQVMEVFQGAISNGIICLNGYIVNHKQEANASRHTFALTFNKLLRLERSRHSFEREKPFGQHINLLIG
jgi:hypothetical protein